MQSIMRRKALMHFLGMEGKLEGDIEGKIEVKTTFYSIS